MSQPLIVPLPPGLVLWGGCTIRVTALDPTTGNEVAGVRVANVTIEADQLGIPQDADLNRVILVRQAP
jgi:hypothetical protein